MDTKWVWPFELTEKLGEGGMGIVYRGRYVKNDREVAVKLLPADVDDANILARFEREMEILKSLRHRNIVHCFGGATKDSRRFYAMELVEGGTLEDLLKQRGRFSWEQVVEYGLQMCEALAFAHERGVVHRDVKPGNFLITATGELKLSDFGLSTVVAARRITAAGKTMGTYRYMAPEQIRGEVPSPQTDLYALGCVLYELLAGRPPFRGDTPAAVLHQHLNVPPESVTTLVADCPPALDELISQLLEKNVTDRPGSAMHVGIQLQQLAHKSPLDQRLDAIKTKPASERKRPKSTPPTSKQILPTTPLWLLVVCGLVMLILSAGIYSLWGEKERADRAESLWIAATRHDDPKVRLTAVRSIGQSGSDSEEFVAALEKRLTDDERLVRAEAAQSLGELGDPARSSIPELIKLQQNDPDPAVRNSAEAAIESIRNSDSGTSIGSVFIGIILLIGCGLGGWWLVRRFRENTAL